MFYTLDSLAPQDLSDGYRARMYHGNEITFAVVEIDPNAPLPSHSHRNEQLGLIERGELTFNVDGERRTVRTSEGWVIPANAAHDATAGPSGAVVIETWSPPRNDFRELAALAPCKPSWPDGV